MIETDSKLMDLSKPGGVEQIVGFAPDLLQDGVEPCRDVLHALDVLVPPKLRELCTELVRSSG